MITKETLISWNKINTARKPEERVADWKRFAEGIQKLNVTDLEKVKNDLTSNINADIGIMLWGDMAVEKAGEWYCAISPQEINTCEVAIPENIGAAGMNTLTNLLYKIALRRHDLMRIGDTDYLNYILRTPGGPRILNACSTILSRCRPSQFGDINQPFQIAAFANWDRYIRAVDNDPVRPILTTLAGRTFELKTPTLQSNATSQNVNKTHTLEMADEGYESYNPCICNPEGLTIKDIQAKIAQRRSEFKKVIPMIMRKPEHEEKVPEPHHINNTVNAKRKFSKYHKIHEIVKNPKVKNRLKRRIHRVRRPRK